MYRGKSLERFWAGEWHELISCLKEVLDTFLVERRSKKENRENSQEVLKSPGGDSGLAVESEKWHICSYFIFLIIPWEPIRSASIGQEIEIWLTFFSIRDQQTEDYLNPSGSDQKTSYKFSENKPFHIILWIKTFLSFHPDYFYSLLTGLPHRSLILLHPPLQNLKINAISLPQSMLVIETFLRRISTPLSKV